MQTIIIFLLFVAALIYVIHLFRRTFNAKGGECNGCGTGSCNKIDVEKIEKEIKSR